MHGLPGAGKTCSLHLLLNEPPPSTPDQTRCQVLRKILKYIFKYRRFAPTNSTPIACPAVQATSRISIDDKKKWERVDIEGLLNQLASTEVDKVLKAPTSEDDAPNYSDELLLTTNKSPTNEPVENGPAEIEPVENGPAEIEPAENGPAENGPAENGPAENRPAENRPAENGPAKIEPAEIEPAENGPAENGQAEIEQAENKLTSTDLFEKVLHAFKTGESKKLSTNWVYFIDSGGQPAYRELLPLFTRVAALNIITIDLTKDLDEKCQFQYRINQREFPINTNLKYSNRGIIQSTISSEAMLNSIEIPYVSDMPKHSHYLILGTRKELVTKEKVQEMNESLIEYIANDKVIKLCTENQNSVIFPVNTMLRAGPERERASEDLCTEISTSEVAMTIDLPIRLFFFEISLKMEAKKKGRSFLTNDEVKEIGKPILDESDIDKALEFLHNVTLILYFREVPPNIIFVDPEPILHVLSRLIAITYVDHNKLRLIANPPPSPGESNNLRNFGLINQDLLSKIGKEIFEHDHFKPFHMIDLLKHLHIIADMKNKKGFREGDYFFPCALPSYDKLNDPPTEIQPLLIAWEIDNKGTKTLAIPQGLFPLTIVHLLEQDDVNFTPVGKEYECYRCHDAMSLRVNEEYTIYIINRYTHIEIRFYDCKEFCPQIRKLVTEAIKKSSNNLKVGKNHIFAFKCPPPKSEQCYCVVKEDKSFTRCTQCLSQCKVLEGDDDSYRCWFSDQLSSPG